MKPTLATKIIAAAVVVPALILSVFITNGGAPFHTANAAVQDDQQCSTLTLVSDGGAQTAGYTETNPGGAPASLAASAYSDGSFIAASPTPTSAIPPWIDPSTAAPFAGSGAHWVSSASTWPGQTGNTEGSALNDQWRLFQHTFSIPANSTVTSAQIWYTADDAATVYLNGAAIGSTGNVYDAAPASSTTYFNQIFNATMSPTVGANTLKFVVRNWNGSAATNPTGLLYKAVITYCPAPTPTSTTAKVTIVKYLDGQAATASSSNSVSFPMLSTWTAANLNNGTTTSGSFTLGPTGFNSASPYTAVTADMTSGASYSVHEDLGTSLVGPQCDTGKPYSLVGYSWGDSLANAASGTVQQGPPSFDNLTSDKTVVVWNHDCNATTTPPTPTSTPTSTEPQNFRVHILKYLDGAEATASSSNGYLFPFSATWQAANLNGNATGTGTFVLGNNTDGGSPYGATTVGLQQGASYSFSETTSGSSTQVLPIGATCAPGMWRLDGYQTSGTSFAAAANASMSTTSPSFANLQGDEYVIVRNETCPTSVDNGQLQVTGIDMIKSTSTADGTFDGGWKYIFHITVPNNEPNISMKFSDWMQNASSTGSSTIPVANNMRISSMQTTSSSTVTLTAANSYSSPALVVNGDLNPSLAGKQIDVLVEVNIPLGTNPGSYTTTYGVRSLP